MAAELSADEEQATKVFLDEVNQLKSGYNGGPVAWNTGVKFLMARKFDIKRAVDLFVAHEETRQREGITAVDPTDICVRRELLTEKFTILSGRDTSGAAVALFNARCHYPARTTQQAVLKGLVYQLDVALESTETQRNGLVFIYDMTNSRYSNFDYELSIKILNMLKGSYPARLKKVLIVTAPLWFRAPFRILRLFVREKLRDRVYTITLNQLPMHIPRGSLPRHLGGNLEVNHYDWVRTCLKTTLGVNNDFASDFAAYFELNDNIHSILDLSSESSIPDSPTGDQNNLFISDMESDGSKETVPEKHNNEDREKEVTVEKNDLNSHSGKIHNSQQKASPSSQARKRGSENSPTHTEDPDQLPASQMPRKRRPNSPIMVTQEPSLHEPEDGGVTLEELVVLCRMKGRNGLYREYAEIKGEPPSGHFDISKAKYNLPKNRYTDVLCFDHSRVQLQPCNSDPSSDYINANFVDGYKHKNKYISTQGPLPRTFGDFWRMVWEQLSLIIVMTTRTVERSRLKCGQYWPIEENSSEEYCNFIVTNLGVDRRKDFTRTKLLLKNKETLESREVTHFQFTSWPDYGVPHSAEAFLDFMFDVRNHQQERVSEQGDKWKGHPQGPPLVVHCSAGIGRTGTFITMDISTQRLEDIHTIDVENTVHRIRSQRAFSIQMPDQYVFCHLALLEHGQREGLLDEIDLTGFDDSDGESD